MTHDTKHTPGPWTICKAYQNEFTRTVPIKVGSAPAYTICEVLGAPKGNLADINARLIAAAPEMLEVIQHFVRLWPVIAPRTEPKATPEVLACWRQACAIIAKATGR